MRQDELDRDVDVDQLAFELQAHLELANFHFVLFGDPQELDRGRRAISAVLERAAEKPPPAHMPRP